MRIALLGLGLVGGSLARAVRRGGQDLLVAWTPSGAGPAAGLAGGVLDEAPPSPEAAIEGADLVVLAAPPLECLELIDRIAGAWRSALRPEATITDVASTKGAIVRRADDAGLPFVGGHPMAGREMSGYSASSEDLFTGRPWVVVPGAAAREADIVRVEELASRAGGRPVRMSAADHDAAVAAISHLPLLASAALVEAVGSWVDAGMGDPRILASLAASGWRDMTRLSAGDPAMGAGILATNTEAVVEVLERLRRTLDAWAAELAAPEGPDPGRLEERLGSARSRLASMGRPVEG